MFAQSETNFNVAIGLQRDGEWSSHSVDSWGYLEPKFTLDTWQPDVDGSGRASISFIIDELEIATRDCEFADLRGDNFNDAVQKGGPNIVASAIVNMTCIESPDQIVLSGQSRQQSGSILSAGYERCKGRSYCKTE